MTYELASAKFQWRAIWMWLWFGMAAILAYRAQYLLEVPAVLFMVGFWVSAYKWLVIREEICG